MLKFKSLATFVYRQRKSFSRSCQLLTGEPLSVPSPDGQEVFSEKIEKLVTDISQLTLIEVSDLSNALKKRLNLPDAPMMPAGGLFSAAKAEVEDEAPKVVQTIFSVKLMGFDEKQKIALIKECKNLLDGMNLVQAKKFVESAPALIKADVTKEEAEKLKEALSKVGGEIVVE